MANVFEPFCLASRCAAKRVGGLTRLRNDNRQHLLGNDRIAIPELAAIIDLDRNARQFLDHEFAGQRRMPTGSTRDDFDRLELAKFLRRDTHLVQEHPARFLADAAQHGIADCPWLLKDLLEHEVLVAALLGHDGVPKNVRDLPLDEFALKIGQTDAIGGEDGHISIGKEEHVTGVAEDRGHIGGDEVFAIS